MLASMLLRLIGLVISGAAVSIVWRQIDPFLDKVFSNPYLGAVYLIAFLFVLFYILFPLGSWFVYRASSEKKVTHYYLEIYVKGGNFYISILRIYRNFISGEVKIHGNTYKYVDRRVFRYFGSWESARIGVDKGKADSHNIAYLYEGWHDVTKTSAQVPGVAKYFVYPEGAGRGYFCDLDNDKPTKVSLGIYRLAKRSILNAILTKKWSSRYIRYTFTNFLIKDINSQVQMLNELSSRDWAADWLPRFASDRIRAELAAQLRGRGSQLQTISTETKVQT